MPGELPFGQLSAACIALLLTVVTVIGVVRGGPRGRYFVNVLLLAVPLTGFVAYALVPGPPPRFGTSLGLAAPPALAALAAGLVMVGTGARRRRPLGRSTPRLLPPTVRVGTVVDAMVPGESVVTSTADGMVKSSIDLVDTASGTALTVRGEELVPYRAAVLGTVLLLRSQRWRWRAEAKRSLARLKELLEQP